MCNSLAPEQTTQIDRSAPLPSKQHYHTPNRQDAPQTHVFTSRLHHCYSGLVLVTFRNDYGVDHIPLHLRNHLRASVFLQKTISWRDMLLSPEKLVGRCLFYCSKHKQQVGRIFRDLGDSLVGYNHCDCAPSKSYNT